MSDASFVAKKTDPDTFSLLHCYTIDNIHVARFHVQRGTQDAFVVSVFVRHLIFCVPKYEIFHLYFNFE